MGDGMRDTAIVTAILLILLIGGGSAVMFLVQGGHATADTVRMNLSTDRTVYPSRETMEILVEIDSASFTGPAALRMEGITDISGRPRYSLEETVVLRAGMQTFTYSFELPVCSRCAGLPPGDYLLHATLEQGDRTLAAATHGIRIE